MRSLHPHTLFDEPFNGTACADWCVGGNAQPPLSGDLDAAIVARWGAHNAASTWRQSPSQCVLPMGYPVARGEALRAAPEPGKGGRLRPGWA